MTKVDKMVRHAADAAYDNGYIRWPSVNHLAVDMCTFDADIEKHEIGIVESSIMRQNILRKDDMGFSIVRSDAEGLEG